MLTIFSEIIEVISFSGLDRQNNGSPKLQYFRSESFFMPQKTQMEAVRGY